MKNNSAIRFNLKWLHSVQIFISACIIILLGVKGISAQVHVFEVLEIKFTGSKHYDNPYTQVDLWVDLQGPDNISYKIPAFWDSGQIWRARLVATKPGKWDWFTPVTKTGDNGLDNKSGSFYATEWGENEKNKNPNRRGFIKVSNNGHTLEYSDGTPCFLIADTWWSCLTAVYNWNSADCPAGIDFRKAVDHRKRQGFNSIAIIACFPSDTEFPMWTSAVKRKKIAEDGSTPFQMQQNEPEKRSANFLKINPVYWQQVDRKMKYFAENGFIPFIETIRRHEEWPEDDDAEKSAYTDYIKYLWARYGCYNLIFSWLHWDAPTGRNEDWHPMIEKAFQKLGEIPYGQPMMAMAAGASDDTWGHGDKVPWMRMHNVSNKGRDKSMFSWLRRQYNLPNPMPTWNVEPYYPGWGGGDNNPSPPLNDKETEQFMAYGSVLNGGFAGHIRGDVSFGGAAANDFQVNGKSYQKGLPCRITFDLWDSGELRHLKSFILDEQHDYSLLEPSVKNIENNENEWISFAMSADKAVGLGYIAAKAKTKDIINLKNNSTYYFEWWNTENGKWKSGKRVKTDSTGRLVMPAKPTSNGWAFRIREKK